MEIILKRSQDIQMTLGHRGIGNFLPRFRELTIDSCAYGVPYITNNTKLEKTSTTEKITTKGDPWALGDQKKILSKFCKLTIYWESIWGPHKKHKIRKNCQPTTN